MSPPSSATPPAAGPFQGAAVIGGTHGLGRALALAARERGLRTVVYGRSATHLPDDEGLLPRFLDLCDPQSVRTVSVDVPQPCYVLWVAGAFLKKPLVETTECEVEQLTRLLFTGPVLFLRRLLARTAGPVHLITIASSSSWKRRERESLYCGLKAAQATLVRNLVPEMRAAHPENRITLINPGGLAVPDFHTGLDLDFGAMMDPGRVAEIVWDIATGQRQAFTEVQILRSRAPGSEGTPEVSYGARAPQPPEEPAPVSPPAHH
ncbi:SDR family NAD(P)-dependent oxidoreductase [Streptomyces sp. SID8382]|uniref:SDR family oxidoreductase n=1 Tax=Streptomyces malaysiensis TaxID=92644 RepID=UPI000C2C97F0|nr:MULTISPECIES: SDR family oxidoreductase [unclassified Streptomyces]AUA16915.1 short chain dehydrogenase [Streptomyces sp. M56]MYX55550.1 SDR family NAD(P)-dependent oxidoreductase [Streptomyces sp. SID8382]